MFQFNLIHIDSTILVRAFSSWTKLYANIEIKIILFSQLLWLTLSGKKKRERYQNISISREEAKFQANTYRSARRLGFIEYLGILSQNGRSSSS